VDPIIDGPGVEVGKIVSMSIHSEGIGLIEEFRCPSIGLEVRPVLGYDHGRVVTHAGGGSDFMAPGPDLANRCDADAAMGDLARDRQFSDRLAGKRLNGESVDPFSGPIPTSPHQLLPGHEPTPNNQHIIGKSLGITH
jgi:hypothetical protein